MRLFSWLLDCRASLAMTGSVQRRPLPVIARRSCAAAIQSFSVRRPEEAAFDQCFGHLFLFRRSCAAAIQPSSANAREKGTARSYSRRPKFAMEGDGRRVAVADPVETAPAGRSAIPDARDVEGDFAASYDGGLAAPPWRRAG